MKEKIEAVAAQLKTALLYNSVEVLLVVFFCVFGCYRFECKVDVLPAMLSYAPVFFLSAYLLNQLTIGGKMRFVYYLSLFFILPFFWLEVEPFSVTLWVSLVVIQLLYLMHGWKRDNDRFAQSALCYILSVLSAFFLAGITWMLSMSIYYSIQYVFEVWERAENAFIAYSSSIVFWGIAPLLFLLFDRKRAKDGYGVESKLFDVLLNYVLTPALLVYGGILYLYFVKIVLQWSLPKGGVAYIAIGFVSAAFLLKGLQNFLFGRYYDWFYRHVSWIVVPVLVMYWVGACFRIDQYGFTEARVYLVVVGLILSGMTMLFFTNRWGRYLYVACLAVVLLSLVTYIPFIRAKDIERWSQAGRDNDPPKDEFRMTMLEVENSRPMDITAYRTVQPVSNYFSKNIWMNIEHDSLFIYNGEADLYRQSLDRLLEQQLAKVGVVNGRDTIPLAAYPALLTLEIDSGLATLVFEALHIRYDSAYHLSHANGGFYLIKK